MFENIRVLNTGWWTMGSEESEMERNQIMVLNAKPPNLDLFLNNLTQGQAIWVSPFLFVLLLFILPQHSVPLSQELNKGHGWDKSSGSVFLMTRFESRKACNNNKKRVKLDVKNRQSKLFSQSLIFPPSKVWNLAAQRPFPWWVLFGQHFKKN